MAYVSLYRKYRSQTFAEVVGQDHVTHTLARAVDEGRWHHAYLFTGPRGTGKTSTARILAKSLNCEHGPTSAPDNTCTQCVAITEGSSVDVIEIDAASHGGVDDVRDLRERVAFAPASARTKVYIVDECHMLSTAGWNAFLKTVEEPPGHVVFVFATTEPHKVLPTILSRTQRFDFRRIPADLLAAHCEGIARREGLEFEAGALDLVVRAGDGSARDTLSVLDQVVAFSGPRVTLASVAEVLGSSADELLVEVADAIAAGDVAGVCVLVQRLADGGVDLRQFARDAVEHLRALFLLQVAPDAGLVETTPERLERLTAQAGRLGRVELLRAVELLSAAQLDMRRGNTRLPLEIALVKAALPEASADPAALAARMDRLERRTGVDPVPVASPAPHPDPTTVAEEGPGGGERPAVVPEDGDAAPPAPVPPRRAAPPPAPSAAASPPEPASPLPPAPPVEPPSAAPRPTPDPAPAPQPSGQALGLDLVRASWPAVVAAVKSRRKRRLHAYLSLSVPVALDGRVLTLQFAPKDAYPAKDVTTEEWTPLLAEVFVELFGEPLRLRSVLGEGAGPGPSPDPLAEQEADVAETEAAEAAGELPDDDAARELAIATLRRDLGATVLSDGGPG